MSDLICSPSGLIRSREFTRPLTGVHRRVQRVNASALAGRFSPVEAARACRLLQFKPPSWARVAFVTARCIPFYFRNIPAPLLPCSRSGRLTYALVMAFKTFRALRVGDVRQISKDGLPPLGSFPSSSPGAL